MDDKPTFVGGMQDAPAPTEHTPEVVKWIMKGVAGLAVLALLAGAVVFGLPLARSLSGHPTVTPTPATVNGQPEPAAAARYVRALRNFDPVAMRAEVTQQCINDPEANLCFDRVQDANFVSHMRGKSIVTNFIGSFSGAGAYKVAAYSLTLRDAGAVTGNFILSITLAENGRIIRVVLVSVTPVAVPGSV